MANCDSGEIPARDGMDSGRDLVEVKQCGRDLKGW